MSALLGLAALAASVPVVPAHAQSLSSTGFAVSSAGRWVMTSSHQRHDRGDGRFRGHVHRGLPAAYAYDYAGYDAYGDFDGNRSFDPDKWNDWWHDRPDRAYPRWMSRNQ